MTASAPAIEQVAPISLPPTRRRRRSGFWRQKSGLVGLALVGFVGAVALVGPIMVPVSPFEPVAPPFHPPSAATPFGADDLGRDVLSGVVHGARVSLVVGLAVALLSSLVGATVGLVGGFFGGWADDALMRFTELVDVLPRYFLAVLAAALFGPSLLFLTLLLGLTFWPGTARLMRSQVLTVREREYVHAARAIGASNWRVIVRHVLPNSITVIVVAAALQIGAAILVEAGLSFLGLGDRSVVTWGYMLNNAQNFLRLAWWMSVFPGIALLLTVLGANLLADGLQAWWDTRLA
ncbi:MAG: ABC transporter permease [Chloroflexota bacterium]|nr:ABC transporter permease [Dehalococcoidia bacterium]MDW8253714.1 ABC transporter permease [Chloroflexota bacterium]